MNMNRMWVNRVGWAMLLLLSGIPSAHADIGKVIRVDGPRFIAKMGLLSEHFGQLVRIRVAPNRDQGVGLAVVTDIDGDTRSVGFVMVRDEGAARARQNRAGNRRSSGYKAEETALVPVTDKLVLIPQDLIVVEEQERFFTHPPEFQVPHDEARPLPEVTDIEMPPVFVNPATLRPVGQAPAPLPVLPSIVNPNESPAPAPSGTPGNPSPPAPAGNPAVRGASQPGSGFGSVARLLTLSRFPASSLRLALARLDRMAGKP